MNDIGGGLDADNDTEKYKSPGDAAVGRQPADQAKQSKEYFEVNFQFNYSGDDDSPIKLGIDVNAGQG